MNYITYVIVKNIEKLNRKKELAEVKHLNKGAFCITSTPGAKPGTAKRLSNARKGNKSRCIKITCAWKCAVMYAGFRNKNNVALINKMYVN